MNEAFSNIPPMVSRKCLIAADDGSVRISWEDIRGIDSYIATITERLQQESKAREGREALLQANERLTALLLRWQGAMHFSGLAGMTFNENNPVCVLIRDTNAALSGGGCP